MKTLSITPSLYNSWYYYVNASQEYRDKAYNDFMHVLEKITTSPTAAMQLGLDYEQKLQALSEKRNKGLPWDDNDKDVPDIDKEIAELLQNCIWQMTVQEDVQIAGQGNVRIYGRIDAYDPFTQTIYDLKRTSSAYKPAMYSYSIQHLIYMKCLAANKFRYIVRTNSNTLYTDDYININVDEQLNQKLDEFLFWVQSNPEIDKVYRKKWRR